MLKYTIKFLTITTATSILYFFLIGILFGFVLTEGYVNVPLSLIFIVFNIFLFITIWRVTLKSPKIFYPNKLLPFSVLEMNIPTIIYLVLIFLLLIFDIFLCGNIDMNFPALQYSFTVISPLGINTIMIITIVDEIWNSLSYATDYSLIHLRESIVYYLCSFLNLIIYAIVITITCKKRNSTGKTGDGTMCG